MELERRCGVKRTGSRAVNERVPEVEDKVDQCKENENSGRDSDSQKQHLCPEN